MWCNGSIRDCGSLGLGSNPSIDPAGVPEWPKGQDLRGEPLKYAELRDDIKCPEKSCG